MRKTLPALTALTGLLLAALATSCVEQDDEKPTEDDMSRKRTSTTAPTPRYPVNADLDGKVTYIDLDTEGQTIEPGKDFKIIHYWEMARRPATAGERSEPRGG
jgi:hypothetical protein